MTISDPYDELAERARQEFPRAWVPEKDGDNDLLVSEYRRLDEGSTAFGACKIAIVRTHDGEERARWLAHAVLRNEFRRARPKPGDLIAVRYLGQKESATGHSYNAYRLVVQRDDTAPDWDTLGADEDVEGGEW